MSNQSEGQDSRKTHAIAVSGVVLYEGKVLLVRSAPGAGDKTGEWAMPGGYAEAKETIDAAIKREIMEEASVHAEIEGLIGVRNRINEEDNDTCLIFLLHAADEKAVPDGKEVDAAQYFTLDEMMALPHLNELTRIFVSSVMQRNSQLLHLHQHPEWPSSEYVVYL